MEKVKKVNYVSEFNKGFAFFSPDEKWDGRCGVMNTNGEIVLPPYKYKDEDESYDKGSILIIDETHFAISSEYLIEAERYIYNECHDTVSKEFYPVPEFSFEINGKLVIYDKNRHHVGIADVQGNTIIAPKYQSIESDPIGRYFTVDDGVYFGLYDAEGNELLPCEYDYIGCREDTSTEWFPVKKDKKFYFLNRNTLERKSDNVYPYLEEYSADGYAIYGEYNKFGELLYGLIDSSEQIVIPVRYKRLFHLDGKRYQCRMTDESNWDIINEKGEPVFPESIRIAFDLGPEIYTDDNILRHKFFNNGTYICKKDGCYGVIDEAGSFIVPCKFLPNNFGRSPINARRDCWEVLIVPNNPNVNKWNWKYGLYSLTGEEMLPCEYEYIKIGDTLDYIAVKKDGEWYYVNRHGERVLL